ncbi:MAG: SDR family oxidoreductase [Bacillota bacterium]
MTSPVVLITGCSTGIGRDLVSHLTGAGYRVVATARRLETIADLDAALRLSLDVERPDSVQAAVQTVLANFGRIDVLVNNAGYGQMGTVEEVTEEQWQKVFAVNLHGAVRMIRAVLPTMRAQGCGRIINLSSMAGLISLPTMGAYCASKFALEAMTDALRVEVAPFGIHTILVEPGAIRTSFEQTARREGEAHMGRAESPYRRLYQAFDRLLTRSNAGAPGPEAVSRVIRRAMNARRPKARYQVPAAMGVGAIFLRLTSARMRDWTMQMAMGWGKK